MTEKNFSQKIARTFEIADYFLLLPATFGVFLATLLIGSAPWFTILIWTVAGCGVFLLTRYSKHARGRLDFNQISSMWIGTAIFNALLFVPNFFFLTFALRGQFSYRAALSPGEMAWFIFWILTLGGHATAVVLAIKAYQFNKNQSYR